jgi:predicted TIM-barrel enzyme
MNRGKILEAWRRKRSAGQPILGGRGGPDFLVVTNEDKLGQRGILSLLPIGDANALSLEGVRERAPKTGGIPLIAGVCATDPLRLMDRFLQELKAAGAAGVQNAPSVGLIDGGFRNNLEDAKLGYAREIEMIRLAGRMDLITSALVFSAENASAMALAGADLLVLHSGIGSRSSAKERARTIDEIASAAREGRKDLLILGFGAGDAEQQGLDGIQTDHPAEPV